MSVKFKTENHTYESVGGENIDWVSVTTFINNFKEEFKAREIALRTSTRKKSKWFGLPVDDILAAWSNEAKRSTDLGTWFHNRKEVDLTSRTTIERNGSTLRVVKPIVEDGIKYAPIQKLTDAVYPEHFVYLKSAGVCGQSDVVEVMKGQVNIIDYKTNKEIKLEGYRSWDGTTKKLKRPLSHLDDCNFVHYTLQLSMYLFIILKHNPHLKPGTLTLHHIIFEEEGRDKFDNPIYKLDEQGDFIVKEVITYDLPYLKQECITLVNWIKENRQEIRLKAA
ncbi:MAG TPA: hypothetical protein VGM30_10650 [Puia sp.]|jgi:hypothetical protein